jgi:hypothetical protein
MRKFCLTLACLTLISHSCFADRLFVRNKPFQGYLLGTANPDSIEVEIADLAPALGLILREVDGNWVMSAEGDSPPAGLKPNAHKLYLGGKEVSYRVDGVHRLVKLKLAAQALQARVVRHPEVGTIDFDLVSGSTAQSSEYRKEGYRLVFYGADWAPASKMFKPVVVDLDLKKLVPVLYVDCTQPRSDNYKNFIRYFKGNLLPYTVLLGPKGIVKSWTGYQELGPWSVEVERILDTAP